ncbi:MAG: leucyl/phenylalanyl-tRNA--protein transferase [Burkholderiaceae bacterium]|nr:leucyl/phenylalanyl-tRNA--protein transferase [Burkholderiaceae bacterium]
MIPWLETGAPFPDVSTALTEASGAPGLLAASASLSPMQLLDAYRHGIFPWYSVGQPVLWWSTDPRMVLKTDQFRVSRSLEKRLKQVRNSMQADQRWQVTFDAAFTDVMRACAAPRRQDDGTWITDEIIAGYTALHRQGLAHSVELWHNKKLAGGLYGVAIGRMFYGESMFARETDASKIALAWLVHFLKIHGVSMIDCQQETAHLASLGAAPIPRSDFIAHLRQAVEAPPIGPWEPVSPI